MLSPELAPFVQGVASRNANSSPGSGACSVPLATSIPCCSPAPLLMEISGCLLLLVCSGMWIYNFIAGTSVSGFPIGVSSPALSVDLQLKPGDLHGVKEFRSCFKQ